jgi:hypothetical protein
MVVMSTSDRDYEPPVAPPGFEKHDRVRHPDFGRGYVVDTRGDSCTVFFLQDGKKRDLKQGKLEPCS